MNCGVAPVRMARARGGTTRRVVAAAGGAGQDRMGYRVGSVGAAIRCQRVKESQEVALLREFDGVVLLANGHENGLKNTYKQ